MNKNIVYLVHGDRKFFDQARMSLLTLLDSCSRRGVMTIA